ILGGVLRSATASAEAVLFCPGDDLAGVVEQRHHSPVALQQMATQTNPLAIGGQRDRIVQLHDAKGSASPVPQALLAQCLEALAAHPGAGKQWAGFALRKS